MKKEAVTTSPIASMKTDRVGYHASGMGLAIAFGAYKNQKWILEKIANKEIGFEMKACENQAVLYLPWRRGIRRRRKNDIIILSAWDREDCELRALVLNWRSAGLGQYEC